jgi:hypothetical protein
MWLRPCGGLLVSVCGQPGLRGGGTFSPDSVVLVVTTGTKGPSQPGLKALFLLEIIDTIINLVWILLAKMRSYTNEDHRQSMTYFTLLLAIKILLHGAREFGSNVIWIESYDKFPHGAPWFVGYVLRIPLGILPFICLMEDSKYLHKLLLLDLKRIKDHGWMATTHRLINNHFYVGWVLLITQRFVWDRSPHLTQGCDHGQKVIHPFTKLVYFFRNTLLSTMWSC